MNTLLSLVGLDETHCENWMQFLDFGDDDRRCLLSVSSLIESIADGMVVSFYDHILAFPATARLLQDPDTVARLKVAQRRHFIELCTGPYDAAYFESRLRVGLAHARIGLDPHLYLGGYLIQVSYVRERFSAHFRDDPAKGEKSLTALYKIIMLDIALATEAYIHCGFVERATADTRAYETVLAQEALATRLHEEAKREDLLRMLVHDIRSPVAAMMATARAGMRKFRDTTEPPGRQFALVEATGQNVLQIIDNMVSHARAPGGELPVTPEPFDVAEIVSACAAQLMPFAQQTAHALVVTRLEPAPTTGLDRVLVRRVVSNLMMNACRHTPAGSRVEVECVTEGPWCRVVVADDGPGLPGAIRTALLDGSPLPRRPQAGDYVDSGLGLPFCRLACERMGGRLVLEERDRWGSRLLVVLPLDFH